MFSHTFDSFICFEGLHSENLSQSTRVKNETFIDISSNEYCLYIYAVWAY